LARRLPEPWRRVGDAAPRPPLGSAAPWSLPVDEVFRVLAAAIAEMLHHWRPLTE
jgi:hypothetical protein